MIAAEETGTPVLNVHLLGRADFEALLALQRRLVYEVSGDRGHAALLVCEHGPMISVGREGSRAQIHFEPDELKVRGWPVRWVNRGGGCFLHAPGQLALYAILPLDRLGLDLPGFLNKLRAVILDVAADSSVRGASAVPAGVSAGGRLFAQLGVAVRDWVSYFGVILNVNPDLDLFRKVECGGAGLPMTSLERERRLAINPELVRQRLIERFMEHFALPRVVVSHDHPALPASRYEPKTWRLPHDEAYTVLQHLSDRPETSA